MLAYSILFFFIFRLITDFVEAVYAFGLLGVGLPPEMALVLLWFSPLVLLPFKRSFSTKTLLVLGEFIILAGAIDPLLDTRLRMFAAGAGNAVLLLFLPALLVHLGQRGKRDEDTKLLGGLLVGVLAVIMFRTWVSGINPSGTNFGQLLGLLLGALGAYLLMREFPHQGETEAVPAAEPASRPGFWETAAVSTGLVGCLIMLYFVITSPHVIARWAELDLMTVVVVSAVALVFFADGWAYLARRARPVPFWVVLAWNSLFALAVAAALLPRQVNFPATPAGYPFFEPPVSTFWNIPIYLVIVLSPVVLLNFWLYTGWILDRRPSMGKLGGGFTLASLFLLVMVIFQIGTTVYDYLPVIGPLLRDRYWLVLTLLALVTALPVLVLGKNQPAMFARGKISQYSLAPVLGILALVGVMAISRNPAPAAGPEDTIRVLTYNIQQAYSADGQKSQLALVDLFHQLSPDIIGLQETDSARIAGGNSDLPRYFADHLGYYVYPGPGIVPGTFGVALFSRYPIENGQTFYMYSEGEQTAGILADVTIGETTYTVVVTHLGNRGPIVQQEAVLAALEGRPNVLLLGDFNFRPDTAQYQLTTRSLDDSWALAWPAGDEVPGFDPTRRIDYIFVSPGTQVLTAQFLTGPESDHPGYLIQLEP